MTMTTLALNIAFFAANGENLRNSSWASALRKSEMQTTMMPYFMAGIFVIAIISMIFTFFYTKSANQIKITEIEAKKEEAQIKAASSMEEAKLKATSSMEETKIKATSDLEKTILAKSNVDELVEAAKKILAAQGYTSFKSSEPTTATVSPALTPVPSISEAESTDLKECEDLALALMEYANTKRGDKN